MLSLGYFLVLGFDLTRYHRFKILGSFKQVSRQPVKHDHTQQFDTDVIATRFICSKRILIVLDITAENNKSAKDKQMTITSLAVSLPIPYSVEQ